MGGASGYGTSSAVFLALVVKSAECLALTSLCRASRALRLFFAASRQLSTFVIDDAAGRETSTQGIRVHSTAAGASGPAREQRSIYPDTDYGGQTRRARPRARNGSRPSGKPPDPRVLK